MTVRPILDVVHAYIQSGEGYAYIDHALYNPEELARDVIWFANQAGGNIIDENSPEWEHAHEDMDFLYSLEQEAIDYLNNHHCPEGAWWGHDGEAGSFGCWPIAEDNA